jgi:hypothetical protein
MLKFGPAAVLKMILAVGVATTLLVATAAAQQRQGDIELHKVRHVVDQNGQIWFTLQLVNRGTHIVNVAGVAPSRLGPWTDTGQKIEPGAAIRAKMKAGKEAPQTIWVDTSEGLMVFKLPPRQ